MVPLRWLSIGVLALCLLGGAAGGVVADSHDTDVPHEHPDNVSEAGDLDAVAGWLDGQMSEIHADCAEDLSIGNFDACEDLEGEYPTYLEQYIDVEQERTGESETAETYDAVRDSQSEYAEAVADFEESREAYEEARAAGDEAQAREHAREMRRAANRAGELGPEIDAGLTALEDQTGTDLEAARNATNTTTTNIETTTRDAELESFTPTAMSATAAGTASFATPAPIEGQVTTESGDGLADVPVVARVDETVVATTTTDSTGEYELTYQPVATDVGTTTVTVAYEPTGAEPYLGSNAAIETDVEATDATITVEGAPSQASFDETVTVNGSVTAADQPAGGVAVALSIGGERLGVAQTDETGAFSITEQLPAAIPAGTQPLVVTASEDGLALHPAQSESTIEITETDTALTIEGTGIEDGITVTGTLETTTDQPIAGETVAIFLEGEEYTTVSTNDAGEYTVTLTELPAETADGEWWVSAVYDGGATNLNGARADDTIPESAVGTSSGVLTGLSLGLIDHPWQAAAIGAVLLVISGLAVVAARRRGWSPFDSIFTGTPQDTAKQTESNVNPGDTDPTDTAPSETVDPATVLEAATDQLATGQPTAGTAMGYAAVRQWLGGTTVDNRTHWEFYADASAGLDTTHSEALRTLTVAYEQAAFGAEGIDHTTAEEALEAATVCLEASALKGIAEPDSQSVESASEDSVPVSLDSGYGTD